MFRTTVCVRAIAVAFGGSTLVVPMARAQDAAPAPNQLERVEITGSSIKRIQAEGSLPVQVITAADIKRTGATSTADLVQSLPAMQGFTTSAASVNGGGGGLQSASLHGLGDNYTLVLLNGHRLASATTGNTVDLNNIPLGAIERIEVLTDGASALYGSDAIAGVVNFILKRDSTGGSVDAEGSVPQKPGGREYSLAVSKGFGDIQADKFNVLLSANYERQEQLSASQRSFSKTGIIPFTADGRSLTTKITSTNSIPANVTVRYEGVGDDGKPALKSVSYSPYYLSTGQCAANTYLEAGGNRCLFDYASQVQDLPESERMNFLGSGRLALSDKMTAYSEAMFSTVYTQARYAPPAIGVALTDAQYTKYVTPYLARFGIDPSTVYGVGTDGVATAGVRVFDAGGRTDKYQTDSGHFVLGTEGEVVGWDVDAYGTYSTAKITDSEIGGYTDPTTLAAIVASGAYDPMVSQQGQSVDVLAPAVLHEIADTKRSTLAMLSAKASRALYRLPGGDLSLGLGGEYRLQKFYDNPSQRSRTQDGTLPFDSKRNAGGAFAELVAPVIKQLELGASVRYDAIGAIKNSENFDSNGNLTAPATQGKSSSAATYKLSAKFQPVQEFLVRGSLGSGFRAPTMLDIGQTSQLNGGVTASRPCPTNLRAELARYCDSGNAEYAVLTGGNPATGSTALKPEHSKQWTAGFRYEPSPLFSGGVDIWNVVVNDTINTVPEAAAFADAVTYASLFTLVVDPTTGVKQLALVSQPVNSGKTHFQGIDLTAESRVATPIGALTTRGNATYMLKADHQLPGNPANQSSLARYGTDNNVVFRWQAYLSASLETGAFTNSLAMAYKSSYQDQSYTAKSGVVFELAADGTIGAATSVTRQVASYTTFDWQSKFAITKAVALTGGIRNLFDRDPPLSIQSASGGNMRGYDGRYTSPLGRTFYLAGSYKF